MSSMESNEEAPTTRYQQRTQPRRPSTGNVRRSSASSFTDIERPYTIRNISPEDIESTFTTSTKYSIQRSRKVLIAIGFIVVILCVAIAPIYLSVKNAQEQALLNEIRPSGSPATSTDYVSVTSTNIVTQSRTTRTAQTAGQTADLTTATSHSVPPSTIQRQSATSTQTSEITAITSTSSTLQSPDSTVTSTYISSTSSPSTPTTSTTPSTPYTPPTETPVRQVACVKSTPDSNAFIPEPFVCDSVQHCVDNSDERDCDQSNCKGNFRCIGGGCIHFLWRCDGVKQCPDGSDEDQCERHSCAADQHRCSSGQCLPPQYVCDRKVDCTDRSDELNCYCSPTEEFRCDNGQCIAKMKVCNGYNDCAAGEDEAKCDCGSTEFKCTAGGCIPIYRRCDGLISCPDASDEHGCLRLTDSSVSYLGFLKIFKPAHGYIRVCPQGWKDEYSDIICQERAYSKAGKTEVFRAGTADGMCVNETQNANTDMLETLVTAPCNCSTLLRVECKRHDVGDLVSSSARNMTSRFPWVVGLVYKKEQRVQCTATLITPSWLLTAASCFRKPRYNITEWSAVPGREAPIADGEFSSRLDELLLHPGATMSGFAIQHDIALVHLVNPVDTNLTAIPIGLPRSLPADGTKCSVAGFGPDGQRSTYASELQSNELHDGEVNITPEDVCNASQQYNGQLVSPVMCLTPAVKSLVRSQQFPNKFRGDIGAPVMCKDSTQLWTINGIINEQTANVSTILATPVNQDLSWIEQITGITPGFCFNRADGKYSDQYDCASYLECFANLTFRRSCGTGTFYDITENLCKFRTDVDCGDRPVGILIT